MASTIGCSSRTALFESGITASGRRLQQDARRFQRGTVRAGSRTQTNQRQLVDMFLRRHRQLSAYASPRLPATCRVGGSAAAEGTGATAPVRDETVGRATRRI